jgi:hypothetical protein
VDPLSEKNGRNKTREKKKPFTKKPVNRSQKQKLLPDELHATKFE